MENEVKQKESNFADLLEVLKRCWWLLLIVCVIASSAMYIYSKVTYKEEYTASISIWAMKNIGTESAVGTADLSMANYLVNDYKKQLVSDAVVSLVQKADPEFAEMSVEDLRKMVSVNHDEDTRILVLSATSETKEGAKKLADTWGDTFCTYINEEKFGEQMVTFDEALLPINPSNAVSLSTALLIGILCAILVYGIFFVQFILDDRLNSAEDVERYLNLTVLGTIPNKQAANSKRGSMYKHNKYYSSHVETGK